MTSNLVAELRSNLHGGPTPALHDGVTGKAKCVICGNFNRFWHVISGCNFCQSCVSEALSSPGETTTSPLLRPKLGADVTMRCERCQRPVRLFIKSDSVLEVKSVHCGCNAVEPSPERSSSFREVAVKQVLAAIEAWNKQDGRMCDHDYDLMNDARQELQWILEDHQRAMRHEKASGESRAEFERDRGFVCRCLKCGEQLVPYAGCPKCDVTAKNGNGEQK